MQLIKYFRRRPVLVLLCLLFVTFIPFLGESLFNTKGEPREAIVAVSMLQQGDWILPVSNGGDIPYKPPMLAWCIALLSLITGGEVSEFTSRLPSALAMIAMTLSTYLIARRNTSHSKAIMMALITMTAFEVHRAAFACRVDMLLTAFVVGATYLLYDNYRKHKRIFSIGAILLMSGAVLTKGPVGAFLPSLVAWAFYLLRGENFWRASLLTAANAILSLIIPALWYVAAWQRGGDDFLSLMMEENVGRLTGTMSYDSHLKPWYYNVITVVAGLLPFTLLLVFSLFSLKYAKPRWSVSASRLVAWVEGLKNANPWILFNSLAVILVFLFYCIPASKRSVYLLPIYPGLAFFIAEYIHYLYSRAPRALKFYSGFIAALAPLLFVLLIVLKSVDFQFGKEKIDVFVTAFHDVNFDFGSIFAIAASLVMSYLTWRAIFGGSACRAIRCAIVALVTLHWSLSAIYQPTAVNVKTDKGIAEMLLKEGYGKDNPLYGYCSTKMLRYYTINFYMGDCVINCEKEKNLPNSGLLIIGENDLQEWAERHKQTYTFSILHHTNHKSCDTRQKILILKITRKFKERALK